MVDGVGQGGRGEGICGSVWEKTEYPGSSGSGGTYVYTYDYLNLLFASISYNFRL